MRAIAQMEGFYNSTSSLARRNNNPGNLMFAGQAGATGKDPNGLAIFSTEAAGWAALSRQLDIYASRGLTLETMFAVYAPAGHGNNDPAAYARFVAGQLNVPVSTPVAAVNQGSVVSLLASNTGGGGSTATGQEPSFGPGSSPQLQGPGLNLTGGALFPMAKNLPGSSSPGSWLPSSSDAALYRDALDLLLRCILEAFGAENVTASLKRIGVK